MRRVLPTVLLVLGACFTFLSVPAAYANRTVLDAPTFAERVDELRRRDDVSAVIGGEVAARLVDANPDLVAIEPLVEQISVGVVGGELLSGPVRVASTQFHQALTTGDSEQLVLRVADAGAVVAGVVAVVVPERAPEAGAASATLADIGSQQFAADVVGVVDLVDTLAWLLPVLAVLCLVAGVVASTDRWDGVRRGGWSVVAAVGALGAVMIVGAAAVRTAGGDARTDALVDGVWDVFVAPIWVVLGLLAALGGLAVLVGSGRAATWSVEAPVRAIVREPTGPTGRVLRALALVGVGAAIVVEPGGALTLFAFLAGLGLVVAGLAALARSAAARRDVGTGDEAVSPAVPRAVQVVALALGVATVAGLVIWGARPPEDEVAGAADGVVVGEGEVCNGHGELCDRRLDEVALAATHNSMSVAGEPGWFLGEQGLDIVPQLDAGVRALLVDVWYGRDAGNGLVRTSARSYEEALRVANEELGPEVVAAALRVADAVAPGTPEGDEALYLCHGLCETGSTSFDATLGDIRAWLSSRPDEVLIVFIEDHVDAADVAASVEAAGLVDLVHVPEPDDPLPTLGEMIRSGRRLVVMLENGDGRPEWPWLVNGFDLVQETPYTFPTVDSFSCAPNRGRPDAPLLQINHWLAGFTSLVSDARRVNAADVLGPRVEECAEERGMMPNLVAVNYVDIGDTLSVVDRLNGVD